MRKLALIRDNSEPKCPFGLNVPGGCKTAGNVVERMMPSEEETDIQNNERLLIWSAVEGEEVCRCKYAANIFDEKDKVDCSYGEEGTGMPIMSGGDSYATLFEDGSLNGLLTYPPGAYSDYNIWRNSYYGQYSIQGADDGEISGDKTK